MVLGYVTYGAQWLASALDMDEGSKRLMFLLCLPLIDGVFATLLVTGTVETFSEIVSVSLTVFTGAGAIAVLCSHAESVDEARRMVLKVAPVLAAGAIMVALVAPIYEQLFHLERLRYAAGLALLVIAGKLSEVSVSEKFSVPAVILTGLVLSVRNPEALVFSTEYLMPALWTVAVSVVGLYAASYLVKRDLQMSYIRRGTSVVLATISLSLFGLSLPSELGLAIFAFSVVASVR